MGVNGGASVLHGVFEVRVRDVVDWFRYRFRGGGDVVSEALVEGFLGPECRSVEAVAEPHGWGHVWGFGGPD
jgi:hypothetical protein